MLCDTVTRTTLTPTPPHCNRTVNPNPTPLQDHAFGSDQYATSSQILHHGLDPATALLRSIFVNLCQFFYSDLAFSPPLARLWLFLLSCVPFCVFSCSYVCLFVSFPALMCVFLCSFRAIFQAQAQAGRADPSCVNPTALHSTIHCEAHCDPTPTSRYRGYHRRYRRG